MNLLQAIANKLVDTTSRAKKRNEQIRWVECMYGMDCINVSVLTSHPHNVFSRKNNR